MCGVFESMRTGEWFQRKLPGTWVPIHITAMELSGRPYGARESLCDNAAVVAILKSGQSKDKRVLHRIDLYMGKTATDICPVKAMLNYLVVRGKRPGPLFVYGDGTYLTRQRLVEALRHAVDKAGLNPDLYCSHSFRIGAATTVAEKGMEDSVIKTLGRWKSWRTWSTYRYPGTSSRLLCS